MSPDERDNDAAPARLTEVELALILARTIDQVNRDPEQLRHIVYDLARYKLKEQMPPSAGEDYLRQSAGALEGAIRSVEAFASTADRRGASQRRQIAAPPVAVDMLPGGKGPVAASPPHPAMSQDAAAAPALDVQFRRWLLGTAALLTIALGAIVIRQLSLPVQNAAAVSAPAAPVTPAPVAAPAPPAPLLPTNFGVYGVNDERLYELSLLPSRAQDIRVALSPTVAPANAMGLPDGRVTFIVYRREAQASIPERAELRIIARVRRGISYDAAGKPVEAADDGWYIRNISLPYRVSPIAGNAEMFRIQPETDGALSPGRYGLVIKGQVYDFTIAGEVTDVRHCLERLAAANGVFVSQCAKLS